MWPAQDLLPGGAGPAALYARSEWYVGTVHPFWGRNVFQSDGIEVAFTFGQSGSQGSLVEGGVAPRDATNWFCSIA